MKPSCRRNTCSYFPSLLPLHPPGCSSNAGRDLEHLSHERMGRGGCPALRAASAPQVPIPRHGSKAQSSAALSIKDICALQSLLQLLCLSALRGTSLHRELSHQEGKGLLHGHRDQQWQSRAELWVSPLPPQERGDPFLGEDGAAREGALTKTQAIFSFFS